MTEKCITTTTLMPEWMTGEMYGTHTLRLAAERGYDDKAHRAAIVQDRLTNGGKMDSDAVSLTHPANWLTEDEVEALTR
jgi:hypothetical protein